MKRVDLDGYFALMESFLRGQASAQDFEAKYLAMFKADNRPFPDTVFRVLNKLFSDVDMFVSDPEIREASDLDEGQLLERTREAHAALERVMRMKSS
jgi:hypothetical protein